MKIRVNKNDTDVASIENGECFWYKGLLYMTIYGVASSYCTAVLLSTGAFVEFPQDTQVEKANCMVIENDNTSTVEKGKWDI